MSTLRRVFNGTGPLSGFGIASWLVGLVMLGGILLTPNGWGWWLDVHSVQGHEIDGIVYYVVNGASYTLNDPQSFPGDRPRSKTVYYLPSQPDNASLHNTGNEVIDWGLTVGPGALGAVLLASGFAKRARRNKSAQSRDERNSFGQGIPAETIRALIQRDHPTSA